MDLYTVVVRNELTDELATVCLSSYSCSDAQVDALVDVFRNRGWRKASASPAELVEAPGNLEMVMEIA